VFRVTNPESVQKAMHAARARRATPVAAGVGRTLLRLRWF